MNKFGAHELYGGEVVIHFNPDKHEYTFEGNKVPSSSAIAKAVGVWNIEYLHRWFWKMVREKTKEVLPLGETLITLPKKLRWANAISEAPNAYRDYKGRIGDLVHDYAEELVWADDPEEVPMPAQERANSGAEAMLDWWLDNMDEYEVVFTERIVFDPINEIAGTVDLVLRRKSDGKLVIIDYKTSNTFMVKFYIQTFIYRRALELEFPNEEVHDDMVLFFDWENDYTCECKEKWASRSKFGKDNRAAVLESIREIFDWRFGY